MDRILEKFKMFNCFYRLCELQSRDDLIKAMLQNMDFNIDGHARIILSKVLTTGYKVSLLIMMNSISARAAVCDKLFAALDA